MAKTINTRIILKNDTVDKWQDSTLTLLNGEAALARRGDGTYTIKIGQGDKYSAAAKINPELTTHIVSNETELPKTGNLMGDVGVVSAIIATGSDGKEKISRTAYSWNGTAWEAMDGNYDAENVYFNESFSLAGSYTNVGNIKLSDKSYDATGKSLKDVLTDILDQTVQPVLDTKNVPTASITLKNGNNKAASTYERGTSLTDLTYSTEFTQGRYTTPWNNSYVLDGTEVNTTTVTGSNITVNADNTLADVTVENGKTYSLSLVTTYNKGDEAKDNKGNVSNPLVQREAGTCATVKSNTFTGYTMGMFYGTSTDKIEGAPTSAQIRALAKNNSSTNTGTFNKLIVVPKGAKTIIIAASGTRTLTLVLNTTVNADMTESFKANTFTVTVAGADDDPTSVHASTYTVWTYSPAEAYSSTADLTVKIS